METTSRCRNSPISQNQILVNTFSEISPEGYNAQSKEFVKGVFEKNYVIPQAQNEPLVKSILKISFDLSDYIKGGGS
ncbi:hypothetical protein [Ruminococcus sp.]|uniref:hypothetical protein n=1 Tax=Ruminococcus sp. TaxID=41978 RepID=UPI0025FC0676|nr:hypothetical protein [Ruminococcus sp.]